MLPGAALGAAGVRGALCCAARSAPRGLRALHGSRAVPAHWTAGAAAPRGNAAWPARRSSRALNADGARASEALNAGTAALKGERISKVLSQSGACSRREADALLELGCVLIDGVPAVLGQRVSPGQIPELSSDGLAWLSAKNFTVIVNKPIGVVSNLPQADEIEASTLVSTSNAFLPYNPSPGANASLRQMLKRLEAEGASFAKKLSVVGRLDKESRGLLVLTTDGALAQATGARTEAWRGLILAPRRARLIGEHSDAQKVRVPGGARSARCDRCTTCACAA
jgi:hypothetical protein